MQQKIQDLTLNDEEEKFWDKLITIPYSAKKEVVDELGKRKKKKVSYVSETKYFCKAWYEIYQYVIPFFYHEDYSSSLKEKIKNLKQEIEKSKQAAQEYFVNHEQVQKSEELRENLQKEVNRLKEIVKEKEQQAKELTDKFNQKMKEFEKTKLESDKQIEDKVNELKEKDYMEYSKQKEILFLKKELEVAYSNVNRYCRIVKFYKTKLVALGAMKQLKNSCSSNANYVKIGKNEVKEKAVI